MVVLWISPLSLVAPLCSVWSTYCSSFLLACCWDVKQPTNNPPPSTPPPPLPLCALSCLAESARTGVITCSVSASTIKTKDDNNDDEDDEEEDDDNGDNDDGGGGGHGANVDDTELTGGDEEEVEQVQKEDDLDENDIDGLSDWNGACLFVGWLLNVPATCECTSGTDLLRQFYVLPH